MPKIRRVGGFTDATVGTLLPGWRCKECGTTFAMGSHHCPQCTSTRCEPAEVEGDQVDDEVTDDETVLGQVVESETAGTGEAVNADTGEVTQPGDQLPEIQQTEGEDLDPPESSHDARGYDRQPGPEQEDAWPGNSSETSPAKPPKSDAPAKGNRRKRARTTGSPSRQGRAGSSSASSTGGSGRGTGA